MEKHPVFFPFVAIFPVYPGWKKINPFTLTFIFAIRNGRGRDDAL
jgi:hypothetical protein